MKLSMPEMPPATLLAALGSYNLLPAIVFLPTRRRCDQAASEAAFARRDPNVERHEARREFMQNFVAEHPEVRDHRHWHTIIRGGVASHHAGHIPAWKLVIEKLMSAGLLDAIFATATVAAGVDFPARTVVLTVADARTARGWRPLQATELQRARDQSEQRIRARLEASGCDLPLTAVRGLERLASARARLGEALPQTRVEMFQQWLDDVVQPGRVVGIGRSGKRLVLVQGRREGGIVGVREDGRRAALALARIGRGYAPVFSLHPEK